MAATGHRDGGGRVRDSALLFVLASSWASAFMFIKLGLQTIPPITLAAVRVVLAAGVLYALARWRGEALPRRAADWRRLGVVGMLTVALPVSFFAWGQQFIDTGLAAILASTLSLWTLVFAYVWAVDERLTAARLAGIGLGFAGVLLLVGPGALGGFGRELVAQASVLAAPACYGAGLVVARRLPPAPPVVRSTVVMIVSAIVLVPAALLVDQPWRLEPSALAMFSAVYLGIVPTGLGMVLSFHLIAARGATFTSLANYVTPVLAVILGVIFLGERISAELVGAMVVILGGVAVAGLRRAPPSA